MLSEMGTARTPKQVQLALGLSRSVERVLRYLVDRGQAYRPRPGWFQVMPTPEDTKQDRILDYLRREGRPRLAVQIQEALGLEEPPYHDLVRLQHKGLVEKIRRGVWRALPEETEAQEAPLSPAAAEDLG